MNRPRVFLDVSIGTEHVGRLLVELFTDKTPQTCDNFRQLCTGEHDGLSYAGVPFHRVIDEFMVQGGDIEKGDGTGTTSIYDGEEFEDENLYWRDMDAAGLVCSANRGRNTNGSQFFLTLEPCMHLNNKHTIFGHLVSGEDVLARIAKVPVDKNDCPLDPVLVSRCGELERKQKKRDSRQDNEIAIASRDRGRRRKSDQDVSEEMEEAAAPPERERRKRRQSDNIIDEGIRGRPRLRSASRSPSHPLEEIDEDMSDHSPAKMHKRKRSQSPSRHVDRRSEQAGSEHSRRRRSLPNQYHDSRGKRYEDEDRYRPSPRRDTVRHAGSRRDDNEYPSSRDRYANSHRQGSDGRLGSGGAYDDDDPPVKFKGRGAMKYREPDRAW